MGDACGCRQQDLVQDVADPQADRGHHNLRVRCTASRHRGGAEDRRALLCPIHTTICPNGASVSRSVFFVRAWEVGSVMFPAPTAVLNSKKSDKVSPRPFSYSCFSYHVGSEESQKRVAARAHQMGSWVRRRKRSNGPNFW